MDLGLVTYQIAADWDLTTLLEKCLSLNYAAVELRTTQAHGVEPALSSAQRLEVKKRFADSGVRLWGLGSICEYDSPSPAEVKRNVELTKQFVLLAAEVGAAGVKVRPNRLHETEGVPRQKTLEQIGKAFRECGLFAKDHGVELWMEVHGRDTCLPANMKAILETAHCDNSNICWNSNLAEVDAAGSILAGFNLLKPWIRSCHINELADRRYPWRQLFELLQSAGYERYTLAEIAGNPDPDRFLRYYRRLWEELQPRAV